ncbi:hypothetical protein [Streptomyces sp. BPTC-684]|uniref:hypothetical protein n=1 Tax=Streptomyces sp. BPTC-684 TaxID=3043734 RepID=UPI0024B0D76A|nr:hypothetical protein [Streptomyces sp. BPTC-684]WHM39889.1 hypothetical protein QIY60_25605 [Streptomyces sp. BPTC-684]
MSEALEQALSEALAGLVTAVDTCEDDVLDPDTAVKWLEGSAYVLDRLAPADRRRLAALFRAAALREPAGPWRDDLLKVGDGFGLDEACTAADGVEEFLENLPFLGRLAESGAALGRDGASLRLRATDTGAAWTVVLGGGSGFRWENAAGGARGSAVPVGDATVTVEGAAGELLLLVYGRRAPGDEEFTVTGEREVLDAWLAATALCPSRP